LSWTAAARKTSESRKNSFTTTLILIHPDSNLPFLEEVDASDCGIWAVLSQRHDNPGKLYPSAFFSRKLNAAKLNCNVGHKELLSIKAALEEWHHWLDGAVITDHKNLKYIKGANRPNAHEACWPLFFTCFQFTGQAARKDRTARPSFYLEGLIHLLHSHIMILVYHHLSSLPPSGSI